MNEALRMNILFWSSLVRSVSHLSGLALAAATNGNRCGGRAMKGTCAAKSGTKGQRYLS